MFGYLTRFPCAWEGHRFDSREWNGVLRPVRAGSRQALGMGVPQETTTGEWAYSGLVLG